MGEKGRGRRLVILGVICGLLVLSIAAWQGYKYAARQRALEDARYAIAALKLTSAPLSFRTLADCHSPHSALFAVYLNRLVDAKLAVTRANDLLGGQDERVEELYARLTNQMAVVGHMRVSCFELAAESRGST